MASTTDLLSRRPLGVRLPATRRVQVTRHRIAIFTVLLLALAFYMWTAYTAAPFTFPHQGTDVYNLLTTGFLHGHLYLPLKVPAGLLHLSDPYNPVQNAPYQAAFHDLALYHGHLYAPWGPTPALTLFLPFRITGFEMSESFAAALYSFIGLVCAVALLHVLVRRFVSGTPNWLLVVASAALALTNVVPFILRRPAQYEVAIGAGYCFAMAGILLIVTAVLAEPWRRYRLAAGSLCLGLAVGARPPAVVGGVVALVAAIYLIRRGNRPARVLIPALVPLVVCGVLLAAYNDARFGSIGEIGQRYQLAGAEVTHKSADELAYVPPGLFSYLLVPPRLALTFPHVFLMTDTEYPGTLPAGYAGGSGGWPTEPAGGLFPTMPITLLLFALPILWWKRRPEERPALLIAAGSAAMGLAVVLVAAWSLWGTTQRYEVDYATYFLIAAFMVWAIMLRRVRPRAFARRTIAVAGIVLASIGAAIGTAVSFTGYYDSLRITNPGVFDTLEDITSPFATAATMIADKPVIARVDAPLPVTLPAVSYSTVDEDAAGVWLGGGPVTLVILSPSDRRPVLTARYQPGPGAPPPSQMAIGVQSPGHSQEIAPVVGGVVRLPLELHWGLNRVKLTLAGGAGPSEELYLDGMTLGQ